MNTQEATKFVAILVARTGRTAGVIDYEIWANDLQEYGYDIAVQALTRVSLRENHGWIDSAAVIAEIKRIRVERLEKVSNEMIMSDVDPDDPQWVRILQARKRSIADGTVTPEQVQARQPIYDAIEGPPAAELKAQVEAIADSKRLPAPPKENPTPTVDDVTAKAQERERQRQLEALEALENTTKKPEAA